MVSATSTIHPFKLCLGGNEIMFRTADILLEATEKLISS